MLKTKYSYKSSITQTGVKQHLHDIRCRRQNQSVKTINECHQLCILHKCIFDNQLNSYSIEKSFTPKLIKDESINQEIELENDLSIVNEFTEYSSESSYLFIDNQLTNNRSLPLIKKNQQQRCLSVSSVASTDKRANKVYEKWPDETQISQILGYRIEKVQPMSISSPPIDENKQKKSTRFVDAAKQIKNMSPTQRDLLKSKPIDESPVIKKFILNPSIKEIKPKLPSILCPSSNYYSKRIQTRQWLIKNYFSSGTLPLI